MTTTRLSWRTKKDQSYQSFGCGQTHTIKFMGTCESCGRSVYSHGCAGARPCGDVVGDSPDPRGVIPAPHCMNLYHAREYDMVGRDVITCAACADDGDKYRGVIAAAKSSGAWRLAVQNNCDGSGPHTMGEVRLLPSGGDSNLILCASCYRREMEYRRERNRSLGEFAQFALPTWDSLKVYPVD